MVYVCGVSYIVYVVCGFLYMMCMLFVDSHVDDIVYMVINILYVTSI
jgi:hypothetical protein